MLRFYFDTSLKYTNRKIIDLTKLGNNYTDIDYINIDSPDTINGHIIYKINAGQQLKVPSYIIELKEDSNGSYISGVDSENNPVHYSLYRLWYVSGITQLNSYKFQISLLRDIISENPDLWKNENAYITAGKAEDYNKYKTWGLPFTNTKIREQRLNINGESSFFVFYVNEQTFSGNVISEQDLEIEYSSIPGVTNFDYEFNSISSIPSAEYIGAGEVFSLVDKSITRLYTAGDNKYVDCDYEEGLSSLAVFVTNAQNTDNCISISQNSSYISNNTNNCKTDLKTAISNYMLTYNSNLGLTFITDAAISNLDTYVEKVIRDTSTNKVYKLHCDKIVYPALSDRLSPGTLLSSIRSIFGTAIGVGTDGWFRVYSSKTGYKYYLEELGTATSLNFNFISNVRKLPKSAVRCVNIVADEDFSDNDIAQCLMLAQTNPANEDDVGRIIDIQYLPFQVATTKNNNLKINNTSLTAEFLEDDDFVYTTDLTDLTGINKETDTIKIVSPSRSSQFIFSPYNNNGNMLFNTKITISPYTSVIYIRPSTLGLLINDWNDKDCLIIQEDFSLTNVTSQWTNYIYNNKNYQNTFNRTIQGREFERSWERKIEEASLPMEQMNARNIRSQMISGISSGGGIFALAGAIGGLIGGLKEDEGYMNAVRTDFAYNQAMHEESISLATDQFNYQLENIKSQPLIPSKITTIDCKLLDGVYLEFYSTNPTELDAIVNFYRYNGNRIDSYGKFKDYWGWFIRGKIIISENYTQPEINELNNRLNLGIFTGEVFNND